MRPLKIHHASPPRTSAPVDRSTLFRSELVEIAFAHGAGVDRAMHEGRPLLNDLVRWGQFQQAFALLDRGASPNVADERGWTALHRAASRGNERMLRRLLAAGADPGRKDRDGHTPLEVARAMGKSKMVAVLSEPRMSRAPRARAARPAAKRRP
jgi:ankyrin repeat protein